jgi:RNA polymerase sigma factor (sigma-70 family)
MYNNLVENSVPIEDPQEERALILQVQTGTKEERQYATGILIQSQAKWVMACIMNLSPPKWIDPDLVFSDIMPTLIRSLQDFDLDKNVRLTTFITTVTRRSASRIIRSMLNKSKRETDSPSEDLPDSSVDSKHGEREELVSAIHEMLSSGDLSKRAKFIIDRLARGATREEICEQLGTTPMQLAVELRKIQNKVATHLTRKANLPAEGIIPASILERAEKALPVRDVFGRAI